MMAKSMTGVLVLVCGLAAGGAVAQGDKPADPKQPAPTPTLTPAPAPTTPAPAPGDKKPDPTPRAPRQPRQPRVPGQKPADAAAEPKAAKKPAPFWGPWVVREDAHDILVQVRVSVRSDSPKQKDTYHDPLNGKTVMLPKVVPFNFEAMSLVWPFITTTASSDMMGETGAWPEGSVGEVGFKGRLSISDVLVDDEPTVVDNKYPCGAKYGTWQAPKEAVERVKAGGASMREVGLVAEYPVRCYKTVFDEAGANGVGWPSAWPEEAASALVPQMWVEKFADAQGAVTVNDPAPMQRVLDTYLKEEGIDDVKSIAPARLAKVLTGKVWRDIAPSAGTGLKNSKRAGMFEGFELKKPAETFADGKGTTHDMVVALVALMRTAGIPSRVVIGLDSGGGGGGLGGSRQQTSLRSWMEFAIYQEDANAICWVPVDILKLRKISNKPQKIDSKWRYFGNNDELDQVAPIAFHFTPPVDGVVTYGAPEMWGWMVFPKAPDFADTYVQFSTGGVPKKASKELLPVEPLKLAPVETGRK